MTAGKKAAWDSGVNMSDALEKYSSDDRWHRYVELIDLLVPRIPDDLVLPTFNSEEHRLEKNPAPLYAEYLREFEALDAAIKTEILESLQSGHLLGIGYSEPHYRNASPIWIDASMWSRGRPSWDNSELWVDHERFTETRSNL